MERPGEEGQGTDARHRNSDPRMQKEKKRGLREIERGLARRPSHRPAVRLGRKRAIESVLYALTQLLLLRELVPGITHRRATLHDPLLETGERPADAALRDAEAQDRRAVVRVLLHVAHQFEGDGPRPRDGDEGETALAEYHLRLRVLVVRRGVEDRIVCASLLAAKSKKRKLDEKVSQGECVVWES